MHEEYPMPSCYQCGKDVTVIGNRVGRFDTCDCGTRLHCCRNCEFYDTRSYNECREPISDRIVDKEAANFCDLYKIADQPYREVDKSAEAKQKLAELFRKKNL